MSDAIPRRYCVTRRFLALSLAGGLLLGAYSPALAAPQPARPAAHVVYNKSSKTGSLYVARGLLAGHKYRIAISSIHHRGFSTTGFQNFVYVANKRAIEDSRPLALKGTTPYTYTLKQPVSRKLREWMMVMDVSLMSREKLTVKVTDLGKA
jgi:hypothetical protein